ncbi:GNAT family N-acetyltransferase [Motilibacter sp. E257]|uniref:GNAT family N-acetyltransferase n=2 Tax=Motilibacter deserti TaxID=2714956 RepID=A0ABX0GVQ8_9ACTN|nr:GNAT family N-acetyltransferase [Motilibacter deserti]
MPSVEGPPGWTPQRRDAFLTFHRARALATPPVETVYAVVVDGRVCGAARLEPPPGPGATVEAGIWLGRSCRGRGVGGRALQLLAAQARGAGAVGLVAVTTAGNAGALGALRQVGASLSPAHAPGTPVPEPAARVDARLDLS